MPRAAALLAGIALALASCGGDGDDGGDREDFIAAADAVCARHNPRLAELNERAPANLEELRDVLATGVDISRQALRELEALEPPGEVEGDFGRFLDAGRRQTDLLESASRAGTVEEAARILQDDAPRVGEQRAALADEIGFEECGAVAERPAG